MPILSLTLPFSFTAGDVGLGEGPEWQPAGEAHGQSPPRTDSQSGDCLGRIMGIWGRSAIQASSQRLLSVLLDAGFREKGILSSGLSFHKAFHSNHFMNSEGRVRLEILPQASETFHGRSLDCSREGPLDCSREGPLIQIQC